MTIKMMQIRVAKYSEHCLCLWLKASKMPAVTVKSHPHAVVCRIRLAAGDEGYGGNRQKQRRRERWMG